MANSQRNVCWEATNISGWEKICIFIISGLWKAEPLSYASSAIQAILIFYLEYSLVKIGNSSFSLPIISAMCRQDRALANIQKSANWIHWWRTVSFVKPTGSFAGFNNTWGFIERRCIWAIFQPLVLTMWMLQWARMSFLFGKRRG